LLASIPLSQAGFQYDLWNANTQCSGDPGYTLKADEAACAKSSGSNGDYFYKISYEVGVKIYHIYQYSDDQCTKQTAEAKVNQDDLNKCLPLATFGPFSVGSYKLQIWVVCFPEDSTVLTEEGKHVKLIDLKVGQKIATYKQGSDKIHYSEVYTFMDFDTSINLEYLNIRYLNEKDVEGFITMSHDHMILAKRYGSEKFVRARDVTVGDTIFMNQNGTIVSVLVSGVESKFSKGALAPATFEGTAIINNVVTSNYAIVDHDISHAVFAPLRWAYKLSPSLINYEFTGMNPYAKKLTNFFTNWVAHPPHLIAAATLESN
jgi:hypothetical protein